MKKINTLMSRSRNLLLVWLFLAIAVTGAAQSSSSKGRDFWLMFNTNYDNSGTLTLFITADVNTSGIISLPGLSYTDTFSVAANNVTPVNIPVSAAVHTSGVIDNKGIHVTALQDVTVYGLNYIPYTTDAYLGLPTNVLGKEYIVLSHGGGSGSEFGIVGTVNGTVVTITQSTTAGGHAAGVPYNITLNQGQTYEVLGANDLTGTIITATEAIGVMGANACANIPPGYGYCDHVCEMLPPVSTWGRKFGTVPLRSRSNGDTWRFIAAENGTTITINGVVQPQTVDRGKYLERILTSQSVIEADKPILAAQYANGSGYSGNPGDPFMMLVPPLEQFLAKYTVTTVSGYVAHYINLVAPASVVGTLQLDGAVVPASSFTPIGTTGFSGAQLAVAAGTHNLNASLPFGVFMYGFNNDDSYGYPGGQAFGAVAVVSTITSISTPNSGTSPVGVSNCFTATVRDQFNAPVPGVRLDFSITGTNAGSSGFAFTDASGVATFCYSGPNPGTDTIVASVGTVRSAPATFVWTPADSGCGTVGSRLYVNASAAPGGNGASWNCALPSLSNAIALADSNRAIKSIWVAAGTYKPGATVNATMTLTRADLQVIGGFAGGETAASQSNPGANSTIISGDLGTIGNMTDNSRHLLTIHHIPADSNRLVFYGFSFTNAYGDQGSAINVYDNPAAASVYIRNCAFINNTASVSGGAVRMANATMQFDSCLFLFNNAPSGGAVYSYNASPVFNGSVFVRNTGSMGGAYYGYIGSPIFHRVVFDWNTATDGGAIYQNNLHTRMASSVFSKNIASGQGGAVFGTNNSTIVIGSSSIVANTAGINGGAFALGPDNAALALVNSILYKNTKAGADNVAGADVYNSEGTTCAYVHSHLQSGTSIPADDGGNIRNNLRGLNPLFTNESAPSGSDNRWFTADDGLQLTNGSPVKNRGDNSLVIPLIADILMQPRVACGVTDFGAYESQDCSPAVAKLALQEPDLAVTAINPFRNELQVQYNGNEKANLRVISLTGKSMAASPLAVKGATHINTINWPQGLYQVEIVTSSGKRKTIKVMKL